MLRAHAGRIYVSILVFLDDPLRAVKPLEVAGGLHRVSILVFLDDPLRVLVGLQGRPGPLQFQSLFFWMTR